MALTGVAMDAFLSTAAPTFVPKELRPVPPWRQKKAAPAEEAPPAASASSSAEAPQAASSSGEAPPCAAAVIPKWDSWGEEEPSPDEACNFDDRDLDESPQRRFLPIRKRKQAIAMQAQPKQRPKPPDTEEFKREVRARKADDRERFRAAVISGERSDIADPRDLPWDVRGPPGPKDGGLETWKGQRYRSGSGRWANAGGRNRDKYEIFRAKQKEGLDGKELHYWHPMAKDGYWAKLAAEQGVMAPWQEKEAQRSSE